MEESNEQDQVIIPYPGPRSFNQSEAMFFKGRDQYLAELTDKLGTHHFLMITGASGDGKSSLVFAGLIPHANAGFFKAKFMKWKFVSFRPEKNPLQSLALALTKPLGFQNTESVISNLEGSFSSLVELYNKSLLNAEERKKGYNLMILADQFEEFFTNEENYKVDSATATPQAKRVVQLLIETVQIARKENIPIYVVCTMRSDYFGHCTAYSGLPTEIVQSQFYLERLTRNEMFNVIREPAQLSGHKISDRLLHTLINEINEDLGMDMLPILQHCLYQVFVAADMGKAEMDLIHYAMVGGMSVKELPEEDRSKFQKWFATLSEHEKLQFKNPSLRNVMDTHAGRLFETAHEYYNSRQLAVGSRQSAANSRLMTKQEAQRIIEVAFKCLTKIDENKPVRNLMTLGEISEMIGDKNIDAERAGKVLDIYRIHGNTFLRPFITPNQPVTLSGVEGCYLLPSTVLDITHEALMRNWQKLEDWAWEEYHSVLVYKDFCKQLDKWTESGKKKEYLLPGGSLVYFENWYNNQVANPVAWLARYYTPIENKITIETQSTQRTTEKNNNKENKENPSMQLSDLSASVVKDSEDSAQQANPINPEILSNDIKPKSTDSSSASLRLCEKLNEEVEAHYLQIKEYLSTSRHNINRINKIKKAITVTISALLVATAIALVYAIGLKRDIEHISHSNSIATQAFITLEKDPTLAFRLAEQAYNIVPTPLAKQVIMAAYGEMPFYKKLVGHTEGCRPVKYSPAGKYIVTGSTNGDIKLWSKEGMFLVDLKGHTAKIPNSNESINFSNNSKNIISCSEDSTARLWNLEGKCLAVIKHKGAVNSVCFSPLPTNDEQHRHIEKDKISNNEVKLNQRESAQSARDTSSNPKFNIQHSTFNILTASSDKTLRLSNMQGKQIVEIKLCVPCRKAIFSPDGKIIAAIVGKTAKLFDLNGKEIKEFKEHKYGISDFGYSENAKYFFTGGYDSVAIIRHLEDSKFIYLKHNLIVQKVRFSSDNKYVATVTSDNSIHLWNLQGKELFVMRKHSALIWDMKFSPDNKYIISASDDGTARLWDLNGTELMLFKGHTDQVLSANFSPDGKHVVTASGDKTARIWNIEPLESPIFKGHKDVVMDANFSPDGKYIATAAWDYTARLWEFGGKLVSVLKGHTGYGVSYSDFLINKKIIYSTGAVSDPSIRLWNYQGKEIRKIKTSGGYVSIDSDNIDNLLWYGSDINTAIIWDSLGKKLQVFKDVTAAGFADKNPEYIYTIGMDSSLCLWKKKITTETQITQRNTENTKKTKKTTETQNTQRTTENKKPVNPVILSKNNKENKEKTSVQLRDLSASVLNLDTVPYKLFHKIYLGKLITSVEFSPDNKWMLTATEDSIVQLWNFEEICKKNGTLMTQIERINVDKKDKNKNDSQITHISADKKNNKENSSVQLHDLSASVLKTSQSSFFSIPHNSSISILRFSPDNKYFATADSKNQIHIFLIEDIIAKIKPEAISMHTINANTFNPVTLSEVEGQHSTFNIPLCSGHSDAITDINFSPDSKFIVSGSRDYTVRIWDLEGKELQMFTGHKAGIEKCKFSHNGKYILSASDDHTARLMPVNVDMVLDKINKQKVRGDVYSLSEEELKLFGIKK